MAPPRRLPFSRQQSFCWNRHPAFKHRNIWLWNEAFQRKNTLFTVITLECQTVAAAIWLPPHDSPAGDELVSPPLFFFFFLFFWVTEEKKKKKKKDVHMKNVLFMNSFYLYRTLPWCLIHVSPANECHEWRHKAVNRERHWRNLIRLHLKTVRKFRSWGFFACVFRNSRKNLETLTGIHFHFNAVGGN